MKKETKHNYNRINEEKKRKGRGKQQLIFVNTFTSEFKFDAVYKRD